ncbi:flippase-like domain-containing protein, partial [Candidatus Fermentibacterales bacterium]|nr:flippase-like domain-containing protein [Candidatus Fermentibacterales bacterium]
LVGAGALYMALLAVFVSLRLRRAATIRLILLPLGRLGGGAREKVRGILESFADGLAILQSGKELLQVTVASLFVWTLIVASVVPTFIAMGLDLEWYYPILVIILASLGMLIPTPAGVGTVHAALAFALPVLTTLSTSDAQALAIVFHLTQFVPIMIAGTIAAVLEGISATDIERMEVLPVDTAAGAEGDRRD